MVFYSFIINTNMGTSFVTEISAKINTALAVTGRDEKGFHLIDTIMRRFPLYDKVRVSERADGDVKVVYSDGRRYERDNALRAALAVKEKFALPGFDIYVEKGIPAGAGIGGSSADAAGVARCLKEIFGIDYDCGFLLTLGADVPFQYSGWDAARVRGKGESLEPLDAEEICVTLACGNTVSDTASVFTAFDLTGGIGGDVEKYLRDGIPFNELETAAVMLEPGILDARKALSEAGFGMITMTGSGSGYIGLTSDIEENERLYRAAQVSAAKRGLKIFNSVIKP